MLAKRIIPCLDVNEGRVVKGTNFVNLRDAGDPVELASAYERDGADEIVFLDISASAEGRETMLDVVRRTAERLFIPLTLGGGIRTSDDVERALRAGADKVLLISDTWKDNVKALSDGGVDVVLDPVGGDRFTDSLRSLREGGRVVVVGFTGGSIPEVRVNRLLLNNTEVIGAGWGGYVLSKPNLNREIGDAIDRLIAGGFIRPIVGARFSLEQAADALELIEGRGATGKVVLDVA